jgi:anaerobic magnesium-protoporphyrin IX monomethyl ester cyclase
MSTILFANAYFYRFDPKQWKAGQPYPPLGTIYAAALMREHSHTVSLFDTNLVEDVNTIIPVLKQEQPKYLVIYDDGFNYLTKMCLTTMREAAIRMAKLGKEQGCTVIICSSDSTDHFATYLTEGADFVIHGEGEMTLLELITSLDQSTPVQTILGLSFNSPSGVIKNGLRPVLKNLDELPMPAWDLIDIASYKNIWLDKHGHFSLNIATTRGCPYKCNWCAKPIYGNRYNTRSPEKVVEEIEHLIRTYQVDYFWMCDDIFGLKPGWVQQFHALVKHKGLNFKYKIQSRVDLLLKENQIEVLSDSGLDTAWLGAESGSQKILDAMDKGTQIEQIYTASKLLKSKGVKTAFFLQFGYPGETLEDIKKTIDMVLSIMPDDIGISISYPLPGTKFYEKVKKDLILKSNWTDSDDLDMMFKNRYNKAFYKTLHLYVHNRYKTKKGLIALKNLVGNPFRFDRRKWRDVAVMLYHLPKVLTNNILLKKYAEQTP